MLVAFFQTFVASDHDPRGPKVHIITIRMERIQLIKVVKIVVVIEELSV